jgi:hypothetical protein
MKQKVFLLIFVLLLVAGKILAQDAAVTDEKWTRIETDDKTFSVAFPTGSIIDAEDRQFGQKLAVNAFQNGVQMMLKLTEDGDMKNRFKYMTSPGTMKTVSFKVGEFSIVKSEQDVLARKFSTNIWIVHKDRMYSLYVSGNTGKEKEISRFLYSINLQGKPLFVQKEKINLPEETVAQSALKTSPQVVEAFERKLQKNKINITYEANTNEPDEPLVEGLTRKVVILERPRPNISAGSSVYVASYVYFTAKLKVNFLANGQIGDITVLSAGDKDFTKACIEAAQKIRFVPAQINGKNEDYTEIVSYQIETYSIPLVRR